MRTLLRWQSNNLKVFNIVLIGILFYSCADKPTFVKLRIENKEIHINHKRGRLDEPCVTTCAELDVRLINTTASNFIFYGFYHKLLFGYDKDSTFCRPGVNGIMVFAYSKNGDQIIHHTSIHSVTGYWPFKIPKEYRKSPMQNLIDEKQIIHAKSILSFKKVIDFKDFDFEPGEYQIKLLLGNMRSRNLSDSRISKDEEEFGAVIYDGYLWSNPVKLIVE